jgi:hypothetical protein
MRLNSEMASGGRKPSEKTLTRSVSEGADRRSPRLRFGLVCAAVIITFAWPAPVHAVVVLKKGAKEPLFGHLVSQTDAAIVLRETTAGGAPRETTIPRSEIDELIVTVSPDRLAALDPNEPQLYREYAEELAEKARDPEARETAIRLLHIAAYRGNGKLRKSALLALAGLASTPAQARHWRAAAYLLDPEHDRATLEQSSAPVAASSPANRAALSELLRAVRAVRQAKPSETRRILDGETVTPAWDVISKTITREELLALATTKPLPDAVLRQLLAAEVQLERALAMQAPTPAPSAETVSTSWQTALRPGGLDPLPSLDLLHLTPFDPRASVWRDGKWVVP